MAEEVGQGSSGTSPSSADQVISAFNFEKYARRYQGGFCLRFNRRFAMAEMSPRIANAVCG